MEIVFPLRCMSRAFTSNYNLNTDRSEKLPSITDSAYAAHTRARTHTHQENARGKMMSPCAKKIPEEKLCCQVCSKKKPKRQHKKLCLKHELPKPIQRLCRGLSSIQDMLVDVKPYRTDVRISADFQADVLEWSSGPIPRYTHLLLMKYISRFPLPM
jgi:hypothetical protein